MPLVHLCRGPERSLNPTHARSVCNWSLYHSRPVPSDSPRFEIRHMILTESELERDSRGCEIENTVFGTRSLNVGKQ
jgi:hypothetical protein